MSLLDYLPHTATAKLRTRTNGELSGSRDSFSAVFTDRECWQQSASSREILEFEKRGVVVTDKIYFTTKPELDTRHILTVTNANTGDTQTFEVKSRAVPDAAAGLGAVYKIMAELKTGGGTGVAS